MVENLKKIDEEEISYFESEGVNHLSRSLKVEAESLQRLVDIERRVDKSFGPSETKVLVEKLEAIRSMMEFQMRIVDAYQKARARKVNRDLGLQE